VSPEDQAHFESVSRRITKALIPIFQTEPPHFVANALAATISYFVSISATDPKSELRNIGGIIARSDFKQAKLMHSISQKGFGVINGSKGQIESGEDSGSGAPGFDEVHQGDPRSSLE
jgi:hypothetical protein